MNPAEPGSGRTIATLSSREVYRNPRMRLHIISPLRRTIGLERVRNGKLLHPYRSQSPELLPSPGSIWPESPNSYPHPSPLFAPSS
jgi:hypothetical protein